MTPTEKQSLLEAEKDASDSRPTSRQRSYPTWNNGQTTNYHRPRHGPPCKCILVSMVVLTVFVLFKAKTFGKWTPQSQIALLNSDTKRAGFVVPRGCRSTLVLMRHCEKASSDEDDEDEDEKDAGAWETEDSLGNRHCSAVGFQRAEYIPTLFGEDPTSIWPLPSHLYAMAGRRPGVNHLNYREIETVTPLKVKSGVDIDARFSTGDEVKLADDYFLRLASGNLCDRVVVVNWKHSRMTTMAGALGCGIDEGCPEKYGRYEFDKVWQLRFTFGSGGEKGRRILKKSKKKHEQLSDRWIVKGKVVKEGFVPQEDST